MAVSIAATPNLHGALFQRGFLSCTVDTPSYVRVKVHWPKNTSRKRSVIGVSHLAADNPSINIIEKGATDVVPLIVFEQLDHSNDGCVGVLSNSSQSH